MVDAVRGAADGPRPVTRLDDFTDHLAAELPGDTEVALWWPRRDPAGLEALAHWWAMAGYQLAPRRVYPLLTAEEARDLEPLLEELRPFLADRSATISAGEAHPPILVVTWGEPCQPPSFPDLHVVLERGRGCVLRPGAEGR